MDTQVLNWWASMRDVLPDDESLAVAVAAELFEPLDEVRPSVMTATMVRRVDATLDDLKAVVEGERAGHGPVTGRPHAAPPRPASRPTPWPTSRPRRRASPRPGR
jgi:hypothetical protein